MNRQPSKMSLQSMATERSTWRSLSLRRTEMAGVDEPPFGDGRVQLVSLLNAAIAAAVYILHYESFRITAGVMDHWCSRPEEFGNLSVTQWKELAIPIDENGVYSRCTVREPPFGVANNHVVPCASWEFDLDKYGNNIVSEWALVCDRAWLIVLARLAYAASCIVSTPLVSRLADRAGRKLVVFGTIPVVLITGVASSLPNNFQFFVIVRAVVSAATSCTVPPLLAILWEVSPPRKAPLYCVISILVTLVVSDSAVAAAEALKTGWATLQLFLMVPTFLLVALYFTLEDSPSWLVATGHAVEAERVSVHLARSNGVTMTRCRELFALQYKTQQRDEAEAVEQTNACGPRLRGRTVLILYMWTVFAYVHDIYVTNDGIPVSGPVKLIAAVGSLTVCLLFTRWVVQYGPKRTVVANGLLFSASLAATTATSANDQMVRNVLTVVTRVSSYSLLLNFSMLTLQLYPVTARCVAMAIAIVSSRVGDTLAQTSTTLIGPTWHTGNGLVIAAVTMALFVIAGEYLPDVNKTSALAVSLSRRRSSAGEELRRAFRDTLKPLQMKRPKPSDKRPRKN
ncbi:solute carrier family 22 member 20 [Rhipicephalus microplus]|uniref:solute carrier family 22 member 20 n=1 Tax=Rhipicephalus microplus TaxID=6941 RepID=UPI003F6C7262